MSYIIMFSGRSLTEMNFRVDYNPQTAVLLVKLPLFPHDILSRITGSLSRNRDDSDSPPADEAGTASIQLTDGTSKSADFIWLDPHFVKADQQGKSRLDSASKNSYPTVVLEVGLSETAQKLSMDCARWILCTLGKTRLALGMKIDAGPTNRELKAISVREWTLCGHIDDDPDSRSFDRILRPTEDDTFKSESEHGEETAYTFTLDMGKQVSTWKTRSTLTKVSSVDCSTGGLNVD